MIISTRQIAQTAATLSAASILSVGGAAYAVAIEAPAGSSAVSTSAVALANERSAEVPSASEFSALQAQPLDA
ncbi:hypothetical protein AB0J38_32995 [Streptomyces sp. NPDC050095]|uniref:hypothetical protein n=1 Tax=unclassified Streptomyces TaxID=2593676 RepID=UPI00341B1D9D